MVSSQQEPTASGNESEELLQAPDKSWVKRDGIRGPRKKSELAEGADEPRDPRD